MLRKVEQTVPSSEPLTEDEKLKADAAIEAMTALAMSVLTTTRRTRFSEAARICELGQGVLKATSRRVADMGKTKLGNISVAEDDMDEESTYGQIQYNVAGQLVDQYRRPTDENQIIRDALLSLSKASTEQQKLAGIAESEATELRSLVTLLGSANEADRQTIETRVKRLMQNMEMRNAVVPSDVSRGHSTGVEGHDDDPSSNGADANGGPGDGSAPGQGHQARVGEAAVG